VARLTLADQILEELRQSSRPLDDDDLAGRLGLSRRQAVNQACRKLALAGRLHRYRGSRGKIVNELPGRELAPPAAAIGGVPPVGRAAEAHPAVPPAPSSRDARAALPGFAVSALELSAAGFVPLELRFERLNIGLPSGLGCEWTTTGCVPAGPGLYAFTVEDDRELRVAYVGLTSHLWMVTKGRLPSGQGARGGQRYGRPRHAGATRQRVNVLIAEQVRAGRRVQHWVRPTPAAALHAEEERLISSWKLRVNGWNRR
jgi:hypothetical protein